MKSIQVLEVGLRDGIQNEKTHFSVKDRFFILKKLISSGVRRIEIGAFVSPYAVPPMKLTSSLVKKINKEYCIPKEVELFALVPNEYGLQMALDHGIKNISIISSVTESFSQKNTSCSIKENLRNIKNICTLARKHHLKVRGYLSMAFGCSFEGSVKLGKVIEISKQIMEHDLTELVLSDTIGVASPLQVRTLLSKISKHIPLSKVGLHFHNTRGLAPLNIFEGLNMGVQKFDSSIGGLGGCPYAKGSSGNIATEDMIVLMEGMNIKTKIDVAKLVKISQWIKKNKKIPLCSHISKMRKNFHTYKYK